MSLYLLLYTSVNEGVDIRFGEISLKAVPNPICPTHVHQAFVSEAALDHERNALKPKKIRKPTRKRGIKGKY
jgi:hypothetical protein